MCIFKKFIPTLFLLIITTTTFAQFDFGGDTVTLQMLEGKLNDLKVSIDNSTSSTDLEYSWVETDRVLNTGWEVQLCDCQTCYADYHDLPLGFGFDCEDFLAVPANSIFTEFKFSVNPNGIDDVGFLTVKFENINDRTINQTLTFRAELKYPLGTNALNQNTKLSIQQTQNFFVVNSEGASLRNYEIEIFNVLGNRVYNTEGVSGSSLVIPNETFASGLYILRVSENGKPLASKKLIK